MAQVAKRERLPAGRRRGAAPRVVPFRALCYALAVVRGYAPGSARTCADVRVRFLLGREPRRPPGLRAACSVALAAFALGCSSPGSDAPAAAVAAPRDAGVAAAPSADGSAVDASKGVIEDLIVEPTVYVGGALVPVVDGQTVPLGLAIQGGWYVYAGAYARGHAGHLVDVDARLFEEGTGRVFAATKRVVEMAEVAPGANEWRPSSFDFRALDHLAVCPSDVDATASASTVLEVRVVEVAATPGAVVHAGTGARRITLTCPSIEAGISCACQCNPATAGGSCLVPP